MLASIIRCMSYQKRVLTQIAKKVAAQKPLTPEEITYLLGFEKLHKDTTVTKVLKRLAVPLSLAFGFLFTAFPSEFKTIIDHMPAWTNFPPPILTGVDYLWDLIGEPVRKQNILYHIPNIILYSFGIFGIKKLIDSIDRRTWLDAVYQAKKTIQEQVTNGTLILQMRSGHSLLFVGKGDFIGTQFVHNHNLDETVTISQIKPFYTQFWSYYDVEGLYDNLKRTIIRSSGENAGEYIFFPVKDDQIFLPGEKAYDLSPHKLDILCQNIWVIEKELGWETKRIIIIGDKFHKSFVQSEDQKGVVPKSEDIISLGSITKKYKNVTLLDPSDIVLKKVLTIAKNRKIVFRATKDGITEYKTRFYDRLKELGYSPSKEKKGVLTIGYDIFEDQTEQQTLSHKIDDYYPVVLSKNVHDALIRNGYKKEAFLYVPDLVLETLTEVAAEQ
jgi:hypothetical protein